jgi:hypothetical protein
MGSQLVLVSKRYLASIMNKKIEGQKFTWPQTRLPGPIEVTKKYQFFFTEKHKLKMNNLLRGKTSPSFLQCKEESSHIISLYHHPIPPHFPLLLLFGKSNSTNQNPGNSIMKTLTDRWVDTLPFSLSKYLKTKLNLRNHTPIIIA